MQYLWLNHGNMKNVKNKIRKFIIVACICSIAMICRGDYWYYKYEGMNVPLIISTQYSSVPTDIEVYINGNIVFKDKSLQKLYEFQDVHTSCGIHQLKIIVDGEEFIEYFLVFPVRWVYIQIQKDNDENYKNDKDWFYVEFSSSPVGLM